jgi:hypothetical protein
LLVFRDIRRNQVSPDFHTHTEISKAAELLFSESARGCFEFFETGFWTAERFIILKYFRAPKIYALDEKKGTKGQVCSNLTFERVQMSISSIMITPIFARC